MDIDDSLIPVSSGITDTVDSIGTMSGFINQYGMVPVLLSLILVLFIGFILIMQYNNTKMITRLVNSQKESNNFNNEVIKNFIQEVLFDKNKDVLRAIDNLHDNIRPEHNHLEMLNNSIDGNIILKNASREVCRQLDNCSRVAIYVFHNGNKSLHGLPFFKMSCIHEWGRLGNATLRGKYHSDIPLHMFDDFIEDLWKSGTYKCQNIDEKKNEDPSITQFILFSRANALYMKGIKDDRNSTFAGFVVLEFDQVETFEEDARRDVEINKTIDEMISKSAPIVLNKFNDLYSDI